MRQVAPRVVTAIAFVAFISLGLPDAVLGVAWPDIRAEFDLPSAGIGFILYSAALGYFLSSTFAGTILRHLPLGWLLAVSTALVAAGLLGYATLPFFPWFMLLAFGIGTGSGAIDTGLNAYASAHFSVRVMNWLHGFFGIGALVGPLVMTAVLTSDRTWQLGYGIVGAFVVAMALLFLVTRGLWSDRGSRTDAVAGETGHVSLFAALRRPIVLLQVAVFFTYCGVEFTAGQWAFSVLRDRFDASQGAAGVAVSCYWGALAAGRLLFGPFIDRVGAGRVVRLGVLVSAVGTALFALPVYGVAIGGLLLLGLAEAVVFPTLITLTSRRLPPPYVTHAVGFSVGAAVLGGATLPTVAGQLEGWFGPTAIVLVMVSGAVVLVALNERLATAGGVAARSNVALG